MTNEEAIAKLNKFSTEPPMSYREANRILFKDAFKIAPLPTKEEVYDAYVAFGFIGYSGSICDNCERNPVNKGTCEMYNREADSNGFRCRFFRPCKKEEK